MVLSGLKVAGIGVAVAITFMLVNPATSPINASDDRTCSTTLGFKRLDQREITESVKDSQMMLIGTITNVETKVVENYRPVRPVASVSDIQYEPSGLIPWKFVTIDVEKYLFDKTGEYSEVMTFRTAANECVDKSGALSPYTEYPPGTSPQYNIGDKAVMEITEVRNGDLYSLGGYKLDINDGYVQPSDIIGINVNESTYSREKPASQTPNSIDTLEAIIAEAIENQSLDN